MERVSGMQFQDYVTAKIRSHWACGTRATRRRFRHLNCRPDHPRGQVQPIEITNLFASGGLMSTSRDMAQLAKVFTNDGKVGGKRILSSAAIQQMAADETATTLRVGRPVSCATAWAGIRSRTRR